MKDRADLPWLEARDQSAGLFRRDSDKVNVSARSLLHHLRHDRQRAVGPGADDQAGPAPGELFGGRERSVSELVAVWLRGLLAPFAHITSVDDDVVLIRSSVDLDRPESEKSHIHYVPPYLSIGTRQGTPQLLPDKLAALDPAQRRGVAVVLRHVAETFAEVPDGKHTAHTLRLLAVTVARCQFEGPTTHVRMKEHLVRCAA